MQPQTFVQDKSASMPSSSASSSSIMKKPSLLTTTDLTSSAAAAVNNNGLFNFVFTSIVQDKPHISAPPANISSFDNIGLFHQYRDDNPLSACLSPHADELSIMSPVSPFTPMSSLSMYPRGSISSLNLVQQQQQHQQGCMSMSSPSTTPGSSHLTPNSILFSPFTAAATEILLSDLNQLEINTASAPTQFSFDDIIPLVGGNTASGASAGDIFSDVQNPQFNQQHHQQQQQMQQQQQQQHQFSHDLLTTQLLNGFNMSQVSARQQQTNFQVSMAGSNQYGNMGIDLPYFSPNSASLQPDFGTQTTLTNNGSSNMISFDQLASSPAIKDINGLGLIYQDPNLILQSASNSPHSPTESSLSSFTSISQQHNSSTSGTKKKFSLPKIDTLSSSSSSSSGSSSPSYNLLSSPQSPMFTITAADAMQFETMMRESFSTSLSSNATDSTSSDCISPIDCSTPSSTFFFGASNSSSATSSSSLAAPSSPLVLKKSSSSAFHFDSMLMEDRPFKCDHCPVAFSRKHDLKRHLRIHLNIRPYACKICSKSFSRMDALSRHTDDRGCKSLKKRGKKQKISATVEEADEE